MDKRIIIIMAILVISLAGCAEEEKPTTPKASPYIGGSKGIIGEFGIMGVYNEQTKQEEIFEGESFPIEITLKNKGEQDVAAGEAKVKLMGINVEDFDNIPDREKSNSNSIEKVSNYNKVGGEEIIDFTDGAEDAIYNVPLSGSSYDISLFARVVYSYKTYSSVPKVCFKEDFADPSVCKVEETKDVYSSGAPVQVKKAEEKRAGTAKIALEFTIENVGTGDVTKPTEQFDSRYDQLSFEVSRPEEWECKSAGKAGEARLDSNGQATIICKLKEPLPEDSLYTQQVDLILSYDYREVIHKQLRVKKQ